MGINYTKTGIEVKTNDNNSIQNVAIGTRGIDLNFGQGVGWGVPDDPRSVLLTTYGSAGGTFYVEPKCITSEHYVETSNYIIDISDGTIQFRLNNLNGTSFIRFISSSGTTLTTIGEMDTSGNLRISGTLGTGVSF